VASHDVLAIETSVHGRVLVRRSGQDAASAERTADVARRRRRGVLVGYHGYAEGVDVMLERLQGIDDADGWTLIAIQALNRFYRGRSEDVVAGWMTRQDRDAAIADNLAYVDTTLDAVLGARTGEGTLVHVGFSQGVAMAFRAAVRGRRRAAAVIAVGGDVPPELLADRAAPFPPVLLVRGDSDDWYTQARLDADVSALRQRGVDADAIVASGGHEWNAAVSRAAATFVRRVLT
jgi:dienelactone hydrolase